MLKESKTAQSMMLDLALEWMRRWVKQQEQHRSQKSQADVGGRKGRMDMPLHPGKASRSVPIVPNEADLFSAEVSVVKTMHANRGGGTGEEKSETKKEMQTEKKKESMAPGTSTPAKPGARLTNDDDDTSSIASSDTSEGGSDCTREVDVGRPVRPVSEVPPSPPSPPSPSTPLSAVEEPTECTKELLEVDNIDRQMRITCRWLKMSNFLCASRQHNG